MTDGSERVAVKEKKEKKNMKTKKEEANLIELKKNILIQMKVERAC